MWVRYISKKYNGKGEYLEKGIPKTAFFAAIRLGKLIQIPLQTSLRWRERLIPFFKTRERDS
jgi:hypothetical protein